MADRRHHGEGEHHQGNMAMPAMPGSALIMIEPELVFRGLKTILDCPPVAFDRDQRFDGCSGRTPGGEEGEIAIGDAAADQQTARPQTVICTVELLGLEIGQFEITNRAAAVLWFRLPPTGASSRMSAASGRGLQLYRRPAVACPRIETHERC